MADDEDAIYVDIVPVVDESQLDRSRDKLEDEFKSSGKAIENSLKGLGKSAFDQLRQHSKDWTRDLSNNLRRDLPDAFSGFENAFNRGLDAIADRSVKTSVGLDNIGKAAQRASGTVDRALTSVLTGGNAAQGARNISALADSLKQLEAAGHSTRGAADGLQQVGEKASAFAGDFESMKKNVVDIGGGFGALAAVAPKAAESLSRMAGPLAAVVIGAKEIDGFLTRHKMAEWEVPGSAIWSWHQLSEAIKNAKTWADRHTATDPNWGIIRPGIPVSLDQQNIYARGGTQSLYDIPVSQGGLGPEPTGPPPAPPGVGSYIGGGPRMAPSHAPPKAPWDPGSPGNGAWAPVVPGAPSLPLPSVATPGGYGPTGGGGFGGGGSGRRVGSDSHLTPETIAIKRIIESLYPQITDIGGWRASDPYPDHPSGQALDVMIPKNILNTPMGKALGDMIVQTVLQDPNVDYVLWQQRQWTRGGSTPMADRGSPTENHMDHAHVHTQRTGKSTDPGVFGTGYSNTAGAVPVQIASFTDSAKTDLKDSFGADLAADMGLSEGLPGLVKFAAGALANLAFAPAIGALSAVQQTGSAAAAAGGINLGGSGLLGMMGSLAGGGSAGAGGGGLLGALGGLGSPSSAGGGASAMGAGTPGLAPGLAAGGGGPGGQGAFGVGTGAPGAQFGPSGLTTPKAVGRQMGQDAPKGGGVGFGGGMMGMAMDMASQAGGMAINGMAPGAGAAASMGSQIAMDMMNRTAGYIAQVAGIGAQGLLETFMLSDTPLADPTNTVLGRIAIGIAGARPQIPNVAGMMAGQQVAGGTQSGPDGKGGTPGMAQGADPNDPNAKNADGQRPWVNIENFNNGSGNPSDGKQVGNDLAWRGMNAQAGAQMRS